MSHAGTTADAWIRSYCQLSESDSPCDDLEPLTDPVTMDGHAGSLVRFIEDTQAFFPVDDRMYVVAVWRPDADPTTASYGGSARLLEGYLSTMRLLPGGPAASSVPGPSASPAAPSPSPSGSGPDVLHVGSLDPGSYTVYGLDRDGFNVSLVVPAG